MHVGRSTDEILRSVEALKAVSADRIATPVNWKPGDDVITTVNPRTDLAHPEVLPAGYYSPIWYLTFKKGS